MSQSEELHAIFTKLNELLAKENLTLKDNAIAVSLLISDMGKFADINSVYIKFFGIKPPVRACVALPHDQNQQ